MNGIVDSKAMTAAVAAELRSVLARRGIQHREVAAALGWPAEWTSRRFRGTVSWDTADFVKVCDYLEVDLTDILTSAKAVALKQTDAKRALESMLTDEERAEIADARSRMRPKGEESQDGRKVRDLKAQ